MAVKVYRLKPHHVLFLYDFILGGEEAARARLNNVSHYEFEVAYLEAEDVPRKYSQEFIDKAMEYLNGLASTSEGDLEVVDGIDDLCSLGCNKLRPHCYKPDDREEKEDSI